MTLSMGNLGDVAQRSGDLLESEEWFKRSIALAERINDREGISWCSVELAKVQQDLGKLEDARGSLLRAINIGRAIKSLRCVRYALVGLGNLRITEAQLARENPPTSSKEHRSHGKDYKCLLLRARATIQRAIALEELEVEIIIDGRYLLASTYFFLHDLETAHTIALQTLKEAQEYEIARITGRAYRLLGLIQATQKRYEQASRYFEQAIDVFRERELRLDYARTLHYYGVTLVQRDEPSATRHEAHSVQEFYSRGLNYLREARRIFVDCQAAIDLTWVEDALTQLEEQNAGKQ
jgi:tetratricopeptide (TPR) repeat protein